MRVREFLLTAVFLAILRAAFLAEVVLAILIRSCRCWSRRPPRRLQ
jgi:hypothetical protein